MEFIKTTGIGEVDGRQDPVDGDGVVGYDAEIHVGKPYLESFSSGRK